LPAAPRRRPVAAQVVQAHDAAMHMFGHQLLSQLPLRQLQGVRQLSVMYPDAGQGGQAIKLHDAQMRTIEVEPRRDSGLRESAARPAVALARVSDRRRRPPAGSTARAHQACRLAQGQVALAHGDQGCQRPEPQTERPCQVGDRRMTGTGLRRIVAML
jgi:hypothetical protein